MKKFFIVSFLILFINVGHANAALFDEYPNNPVVAPDGAGFDQILTNPEILKTADGYSLYYGGMTPNKIQIGLATSEDGLNWNFYSDEPVFRCGENMLDNYGFRFEMSLPSLYFPVFSKFDLY